MRIRAFGLAAVLLLAGCAAERQAGAPERPEDVRERIVGLLPPGTADRPGWAVDMVAAFTALRLDTSTGNLCAVIAVAEQESGLRADPPVPRLGQIARQELERRADRAGVPSVLLHGALMLKGPDGRSYGERLDTARTEKDLSDLFDDFIGMVPLGQRLFAGYNPVRTGGPMQVSVDFAERHAKEKPYPYPVAGSIRHEVFSRRGGLYFGIAHLLDYPADYDQPIYRFADFNAGRYASRNAAFQSAVSAASSIPLELDGDLLRADQPGSTELAVRSLAPRLDLSEAAIHRALEQGERAEFERTLLYARLYELAERVERRPLPRAVVPRIVLKSPKITRPLTTEWFARRVNERHQRCMARAS